VRSHLDPDNQGVDIQRIVVAVDVIPGPFTPELAARILRLAVDEFRASATDIVAVNLEVRGDVE
jgi:hypothetical protein